MKLLTRLQKRHFRHWGLAALGVLLLVACGGDETAVDNDMTTDDMADMAIDEGMEHGAAARIPNDGAMVRITAPADGAAFQVGEQVIVEVEVENFELGEDGNHWHVYVDDASWGMVVGGNTDQPLTGLAPGQHTLSVYLSIGTHEELEDGDSITITVEE